MSIEITTELIKELRDSTGISIMQCKKALEEAEGDMDKALAILKKSSSDIALKKSSRDAKDGSVIVKEKEGKTILLALHCETDFVSKNEDFISLLEKLGNLALEEGEEAVKIGSKEMIDSVIQKTGENIQLGDIHTVEGDIIGGYVHNGKKAVVVSLIGGTKEIAKDIAMHIAAMNPEYITEKDITDNAKEMMSEIFQKEVAKTDKPEEIKEKILEGKLSTYFEEKTLTSQKFIKDSNVTIKDLLSQNQAEIKEVKRYSI